MKWYDEIVTLWIWTIIENLGLMPNPLVIKYYINK
jgi:hypothetical protein